MLPENLDLQWCTYKNFLRCNTRDVKKLENSVIVFYFAHGLGDFVMFNNVVPFLAGNNNRLYITRVGDDYIALQEGSELLKPLYSGIHYVHTNDGEHIGSPHFLLFENSENELKITEAMRDQLFQAGCTHFCVEHFFEPVGHAPPYHSKPRQLIKSFADKLSPAQIDSLKNPIQNALAPPKNDFIDNLVVRRLRAFTPYNSRTKLVVITRYGLTSHGKNWGHLFRSAEYPHEADEVRAFIDMCRRKNPDVLFISMEHFGVAGGDSIVDHQKNVFSFSELFSVSNGDFSVPYSVVLSSLFRISDVHIGCPTGASGVATLFPNLQNILLWLELFPSWYFEPTPNTINLISSNNVEARRKRPNSFDTWENVLYTNVYLDTPHIGPEAVFDFTEGCL